MLHTRSGCSIGELSMNRSVLMIMGGALLVAIVVAVLVNAKMGKSGAVDTSNQILVTNKLMNIGETLSPDNTHWEPWPSGGMFTGVIKRGDYKEEGAEPPVYNTPLRHTLEKGEPVTMQAVISDVKGGGESFLAASIEPGKRAVSLKLNEATSVAGFLKPGDHVDVILGYRTNVPAPMREAGEFLVGRYASQTILSNVKVLAVDQIFKSNDVEPKIRKTVTIEVTREGADVIALATQMGELSLALRRLGEQDTAENVRSPVTTEAMTSEVVRKMSEIMQTKGTAGTIRLYSGSDIQDVPVRNAGQ